jgi:PST family polysaccharide transporter
MVALPALSSLQKEPAKFTRYYTKLVSLIAFASMPLMVFLAVCSENIVALLLGKQWLQAAGIFRVLALAAFIQPSATTRGVVLLSLGQSGRYLRWGIFHSLVVVASFAVGIRWGAVGVASAYATANYLVLFPSLWYCFRQTPLSTAAFIRAIAHPTICSLTMAAPVALIHSFLAGQPDIVIIGVCFVIGFSAYFLIWTLMPGGKQVLRDFVGYIAIICPKKKSKS